MISIDNPSHYSNQLLFNLDASNSSSLQNGFKNPECIIVEKLLENPRRPAFQSGRDFVPVKSDKLSLAIQLAKLDVSNSKYQETSKYDHKAPMSNPSRQRPVNAGCVREEIVAIPQKNHPAVLKTKPLQKPPQKNLQKQRRKPVKKQIHFQEPHGFEDHIRQIVRQNHLGQKPAGQNFTRLKDACTSTADIDREVHSFAGRSDFKQFANRLQTVVKKEKLRQRRNERPAHRSGFLSLQRSPSRHKHKLSSPHSSPVLRSKHPDQKSTARLSSKDAAIQTPAQPHFAKLSRKSNDSTAKRLHYGDESSDGESSVDASLPRQRVPIKSLLRRAAAAESSRSRYRESTEDHSIAQSIFDDIIEDTADKMHVMHTDKFAEDAAHDLNNMATVETLHQRITDIENEERQIRCRWHAIRFDDLVRSTTRQVDNSVNSRPTDVPSPISIPGGCEQSHAPLQAKKPYRFASDKTSHMPLLSSDLHQSASSHARTPDIGKPRVKLGVCDDTMKSVLDYHDQRKRYLRTSFHEPKGRFNPWKIVKELSKEIMDEIMSSVCEEVNEAMEGCVDDIFEGEFADPSSSALQSLADQSTDTSSKYDESFPLHG